MVISLLFLLLVVGAVASVSTSACFLAPSSSRRQRRPPPPDSCTSGQGYRQKLHRHHHLLLSAHFGLTSALESLAANDDERSRASYRRNLNVINWFDPAAACTTTNTSPSGDDDDDAGEEEIEILPLYPLPAVYLPSSNIIDDAGVNVVVNHTLVNTEPRNIRMARDLIRLSSSKRQQPRFCVALRAIDTGRIASVGTVLRIVDHSSIDDGVSRIVLTCVAESDLVEIVGIENPRAASWESRIIRRSSEYLNARVVRKRRQRPLLLTDDDAANLLHSLEEDYNAVREHYVHDDGVGSMDLPPFARESVAESLPRLQSTGNGNAEDGFWRVAQIWQTLCNTVREGRQIQLSGDRNEIMVDAAVRKGGGPLKLPVHIEDLSIDDRRKVQDLEINGQKEWLEIGLDPCLDFQVILSLDDYEERIRCLHSMIKRERKRLEGKERKRHQQRTGEGNSSRNDLVDVVPPSSTIAGKGAWFDDGAW